MSGICSGKNYLIAGVANEKSLAWGIARSVFREGGTVLLSCQEALKERVEGLATQIGNAPVYLCDVNSDEDLAAMATRIGEGYGSLYGIAHCIAFAPRRALQGSMEATTRDDFKIALETSAHSLCALVAACLPLMKEGGSVVTLTYDTARAYPNYNLMGVAKSALEAEVRYLAFNLGDRKIRVNSLSAGPQNTLAARGITNFNALKQMGRERAPLGWDPDDTGPVGDAATYLMSDLSRSVTGIIHYVDGGLHIVGA